MCRHHMGVGGAASVTGALILAQHPVQVKTIFLISLKLQTSFHLISIMQRIMFNGIQLDARRLSTKALLFSSNPIDLRG